MTCLLILTSTAFTQGLSSAFPGDAGIADHPSVVFVEDFESGTLPEIGARWGEISNAENRPIKLSGDVPEGSPGQKSLSITATRGSDNGGHLYTVLKPGHDTIYARYYVKFAEDYGHNHHFVNLCGRADPPPWPIGGAGSKAIDHFYVELDPQPGSYHTYPGPTFNPPGIWHFYAYWPEMNSWQGPEGTSFYGNNFEPIEPVVADRGRWICCEFMVKMNSTPDTRDGELTMWIDGVRTLHLAPGSVEGHWFLDKFRMGESEDNAPFEGFRWRVDSDVEVNAFWLLHYVTEKAFKQNEDFAANNPDYPSNTKTATCWFDHIVLATEYVGPMAPAE